MALAEHQVSKMKYLCKIPYWQLLAVPLLFVFLGLASNQSVLIANHGKFPVMLNERQVATFCSRESSLENAFKDKVKFSIINTRASYTDCSSGGQFIDNIHSIMGSNSHLKGMADIFSLGDAIYSIGDGFLFLGFWLLSFTQIAWAALTLRKIFEIV